jgi:hypothetical protein
MIAENTTTGHNRTIRIMDISDEDFPELLVTVNYVDDDRSRCGKAVVLDNIVIPAIIKALNGPRYEAWKESLHRACDVVCEEYPSVMEEITLFKEGLTFKQALDRIIEERTQQ